MRDFGEAYVPFFEEKEEDKNFNKNFKYILMKDYEELYRLLNMKGGRAAFDTETNGLNIDVNKVVGFSLSFNGMSGIYVPLRHREGNLDPEKVFPVLNEFLCSNEILLYNSAFDLMMMEKEGLKIADVMCFDVMSLVFNADTNIRKNNLKWAARHYLGRESPTYEEIFGKMTVDQLPPEDVAYYAVCDSANTYAIYDELSKTLFKECGFITKLDSKLSKAMSFYLSNKIYIDQEKMKSFESIYKEEVKKIEGEIFKKVGYPLLLDSNRQVTAALLSLGIDTGERTKTGDMKLDKKTLGKVDHPVINLLIKRDSLVFQLRTFIEKFAKQGEGRVSYKIYYVPSGRLASGSDKGNYFLNINYQNLMNPEVQFYRAKLSNEESNILGWEFSPEREGAEGVLVEGLKLGSVREAITVPDKKDWYFVTMDYSSEELKIAAIASRDPVYLEAFKKGKDVHKQTAIEMFGELNYNKEKRKLAKIANFGLLYGGSSSTLMRHSGLSESLSKEIYQKFWGTLGILKRWKGTEISKTYKRGGVCYSMLGRPRRVRYWMTAMGGKGYGERTVISHIVQGTAADVMRIVLVRLYNEVFRKKEYSNEVRFIGCVHDEIHYAVRKDVVEKWVGKLIKLMEFKLPEWPFPLDVGEIGVGYSYGNYFPFVFKEGKLVLKEVESREGGKEKEEIIF